MESTPPPCAAIFPISLPTNWKGATRRPAGLDLAADYIAAQFRRAGLEPGVGDSYFQNASMLVEEPNFSNFELKLSAGDRQFSATPKDAVLSFTAALDLKDAPLFKLDLGDEAAGATSHGQPGGRQGGDHRDRTADRASGFDR